MNKPHNFEKFIFKSLQSFGRSAVTIKKAGIISLNTITMINYVKDNNYADLYFNRENLQIGIKFVKTKTRESYKITKYTHTRTGSIAGKVFLRFYKISHEKTIAYLAKWNEKDEMLIVDLKEEK